MSCFKPLEAYQTEEGDIVFQETKGSRELKLPCGRCIGCRLDRSSSWALRCMHEASLYTENVFITLTYNAENCPPDGGLIKRDFVLFMKKLRKKYSNKKIKFYQCGEYGDRNGRPHYHAILFNHNFDDWIYLFDSPSGQPVFTSPTLEKIWGMGFVTVGTVTMQSAAYIARYCMKKINGEKAEKINEKTGLKHYERYNSFTGEITEVHPEYSTMSRGGTSGRGIAYDWIRRFTGDVYPKDFTTVNAIKRKPPRYYDQYLEELDPFMFDDIKEGRNLQRYINAEDNTPERLKMRQAVKEAQAKMLKRII